MKASLSNCAEKSLKLYRAQISGHQTPGLTQGSSLLLYKKNAGGEPRVKP
jgi:hypothetical protein